MRIPSLPDWAFFTLTPALVIGMIWLALSVGGDRRPLTVEEIRAQGLVFEGAALQAITTGPGLTAQHLAEGERSFVRINAVRGPFDGTQSAGAFFALDERELDALQGYELEMQIILRRPPVDGADTALVNIFLPDRGHDQWQTVELEQDFTTISLTARSALCDWRLAYLGVWPAWDEGANSVDLESVAVRAIGPTTCP